MSSPSKSDIAHVGSVHQEQRGRSAAQATQRASLLSGSSYSAVASNGHPHQPSDQPAAGYPPISTAPQSSSTVPLTFNNLTDHTQATAQLSAQPTTAYDARVQAIYTALQQLEITLPAHAIAELAGKFDGMTSVERFLAEEGYWVTPTTRDGYGYRSSRTAQNGGHRRG